MTVVELMAKLDTMPQDMKVVDSFMEPIDSVEVVYKLNDNRNEFEVVMIK